MKSWKLVHHHQVDPAVLKNMNRLHENLPHADPKDLPSIAVDGERYELYDLVADPGELNDLYDQKKDEPIVSELKAIFERNRFDPDGEHKAPELSEETLEALKAAGYIR